MGISYTAITSAANNLKVTVDLKRKS